jgi:hypothetical protein
MHVTRQDDELRPRLLHEIQQLLLLFGLVFPGRRPVVVGDAFHLGEAPGIFMIGDDGGDLGIQPADPDLVKQMEKRMVELRNHDDDPWTTSLVDQRGFHPEPVDGRFQGSLQIVLRRAYRAGECNPHEKAIGLPVPELAALRDVGAVRGKLRGDRGNDPWPVFTR